VAFSSELSALVRNRRAELWVCQRYDLAPGEEPHDLGVSAPEAALRYRSEVSEVDKDLASLYWNAVWLEGASSPTLKALREEDQDAEGRRRLVVLASAADANAEVSPQSFLPVFVLPGLIESTASDAAYGAMGRRARESLAWKYAQRIHEFPGSVLVVVGAEKANDLELLWDALAESPIRDLTVLISWPDERAKLPKPRTATIDVQVCSGTTADLLSELLEAGAPSARTARTATVRVGASSVSLSAQDTQFVAKRLALVYESAFASTGALHAENLESFFDGSLDDWTCYQSGVLPVPRSYRTDQGATLSEDVLSALRNLSSGGKSGQRTFVFQLPAESASGATTLLRAVAFAAAESGFPTLVARPEQVEIDIEDVLAFATSLNDAAMSAGVTELPAILVVIDVEHSELNEAVARLVGQALAAQGRKAVVLQALRFEDGVQREQTRNDRWAVLPTLTPAVSDVEVAECSRRFAVLAQEWSLGSGVQGVEDWTRYQAATTIQGPNGDYGSEALFWVAIRFFVCEGAAFLEHATLRESLARWITKRTDALESDDSRKLVGFVAGFSSFRLVSPMMTVLRPVTSSVFSSAVVDTLRQLRDVVDWKDYAADLDDQVLTFRHPVIADEYLRSIGVVSEEQRVRLIRPVVEELSPGGRADLWVAETLAATVLAPQYRSRDVDWEWRLEAFDWIPAAIAGRSKAILHHWARCLAGSTHSEWLPKAQKRQRLTEAVDRLIEALALDRRPGRDEHPGHIYNTLGVVYTEMANFLDSEGEAGEAAAAWDKACDAFEESLALMPGENVIAYFAFSNRLLRHANVWPAPGSPSSDEAFREVARALALLDEAEEAISGMATSEPSWRSDIARYKSAALRSLGGDRAARYIAELKASDNPSLGYYCEARLRVGEAPSASDVNAAVAILTGAMESGVALGSDALRLLAQLMRQSDAYRNDYAAQADIYRRLERAGNAVNTIDMFRLAVLCYQTSEFAEGNERFRKIREVVRQAQASHAPQRVSDLWRDSGGKARITQVRVDKAYSDWRGDGFVDAICQSVPLRPRHFTPLARVGEIRECMVRFEIWGPLAVPARLERS